MSDIQNTQDNTQDNTLDTLDNTENKQDTKEVIEKVIENEKKYPQFMIIDAMGTHIHVETKYVLISGTMRCFLDRWTTDEYPRLTLPYSPFEVYELLKELRGKTDIKDYLLIPHDNITIIHESDIKIIETRISKDPLKYVTTQLKVKQIEKSDYFDLKILKQVITFELFGIISFLVFDNEYTVYVIYNPDKNGKYGSYAQKINENVRYKKFHNISPYNFLYWILRNDSYILDRLVKDDKKPYRLDSSFDKNEDFINLP